MCCSPAGTFADLKHLKGRGGTNVALDYHLRRGDVETALARRRPRLRAHVQLRAILHAPFEPFVSLAETRSDNELTIHTASTVPSFVRMEDRAPVRLAGEQSRVERPFSAAASAAKLYIKLEALVAALALIVRRPVRIALTMEEQFYMITKHGTTVRMKTGVKKTARSLRASSRRIGTAAPSPISVRA